MENSNFFAIEKELKLDEGYQKTYKNVDELLPTLPRSKGWWLDQLLQYQGFWLSTYGIRGSMLIDDHFNPRPTDIIVATSPKCGTTWLRALVFSIINRNSFDFSDHPLRKANPRDLVNFLEAHIRGDGSTTSIDGLLSPLLISTHLPYSLFPECMTDDTSACRFIYICRDPKDVLVSKWHFTNKLRPKGVPPLSLEEAFDLFCKGVSHYGPFWDHVLGYWKASLESPKKVLCLKYEDVKKEPLGCVRKGLAIGQSSTTAPTADLRRHRRRLRWPKKGKIPYSVPLASLSPNLGSNPSKIATKHLKIPWNPSTSVCLSSETSLGRPNGVSKGKTKVQRSYGAVVQTRETAVYLRNPRVSETTWATTNFGPILL
ncbi:hypothetical protein Gotur_033628 [Gossypium turneri]